MKCLILFVVPMPDFVCSAKYGSYTLMDVKRGKILTTKLIQVSNLLLALL
jgi:hypothetical protein